RLFNADGGEAEVSGNGTRCVAAYLIADRDGAREVNVRTLAGVKRCMLTQREGMCFEFEIAMGEPLPGDPFSIKLAFSEVTVIPVDMGNPQFIIFTDQFVPGWQAEGAEIGKHPAF